MEEKEYKIVSFKEGRFAIADENGEIIDNAQGYGYNNKYKASKAMWWKFKGGKKKKDEEKSKLNRWLKNETNKKIYDVILETTETHFKGIALGEVTMDEVFGEVEKEYSIELPIFVKKDFLK